jgi:hypothetical protein
LPCSCRTPCPAYCKPIWLVAGSGAQHTFSLCQLW